MFGGPQPDFGGRPQLARLLAASYRAQVEVFHALWAPKIGAAEQAGEATMFFEGRLNALAAAFGANVKYQSRVIEGHPVKMALHYMEQHPPDLIILGSHGYDGYARVMLGSVAENVLRTAPCPILIVKGVPLPADVHVLRTILCAVDFGDLSRRCVLAAGDLAGMLDADLLVAYVAAPGAMVRMAWDTQGLSIEALRNNPEAVSDLLWNFFKKQSVQ
jgi:YD repeat-containing protein